jgi:serine/threonine protein kinase/tetratricopeptide (TPR) repeat protein
LIGRTIGRYEVLSRLGAGGMGVVYKARDQQLGRLVALKFLPPEFADETMRQRFLHEAQAASALDHPAICTIYEIGETDEGNPYLAMAFYEGETLRGRLSRGGMLSAEATSVALQMAEGLAAAHAKGIIHRDIKPPNVFLTRDGMVKILDFGLAQRDGATRVTRAGTTLGTLAYMAPEQVRGEETDQRADIWSLGVVFYECLTGRHPFTGNNDAAILHSILTREPDPPSRLQDALSPAFDRLMERLLAKETARRMADTSTVVTAFRQLARDLEGSPELSREAPTAVLETDLATAAVARAASTESTPRNSVAILSFENLSRDAAVDWLAAGIAESISSDLKRISGIEVEPREKVVAALQPSGSLDADQALAAAERIGARWAIWGSFQKAGDALRVLVHVVDVEHNGSLEPIKADGTLQNVFALQDQIVEQIAQRFHIVLSDTAREQLAVPPTEYVEAYEYCARGLQLAFEMNPESFKKAAIAFGRALELDPNYAAAHSGLGQLRALSYIATTDSAELEAAIQHLTRAIELDPELGDPYPWLTYAYARQDRFQEAVATGRRAVELEPRGTLAHYFLAVAWWLKAGLEGAEPEEWAEAVHHIHRSTELAPRNQSAFLIRADLYLRCGAYESAHAAAAQAADIERSSDFESARFVGGQALLATVLSRQGRYEDAWRAFETALSSLATTDHVYTHAFSALCRCQQAKLLLRRQEYSAALPLIRQARAHTEEHRQALAVGWFRVWLELLAAATFHRLTMLSEEKKAVAAALDLLESHEGYDFSGVWESGTGALLFELADYYAFSRQPEEAVATLEKAVASGWREAPRLERSLGFGGLSEIPEVVRIRDRLQSLPAVNADPAPDR